MKFRKLITMMGLLAIVLAAIGVMPMVTRAQSGNLLQNPGLEQPYNKCGSGDTANGWACWYTEIAKPDDATGLQYALKPYFSAETNPSGEYPELIRGGAVSQHSGRQLDPWIGGIKQTATVPPDTPLRFCAWARIRISNNNIGVDTSVTAYSGRARVGIFPNGDGDWNTSGIVWSGEANPHDNWQQICVEATSGPQGKVVVFTSNDWRGAAANHIDAWWDDAELITTGAQPTPTTAGQTNPQPTNAAPPPPAATAVINAEGALVHTIVSGDTLFGLSFQYNVSLDDLLTLNGLTKDSILSIGQKIIIKAGPGGAPAPQPTVAPPTAAPEQSTPGSSTPVTPTVETPAPPTVVPTPVAETTTSKLCVHAFNDANSDGLPSADEGSVAGVQFAVANAQGVQVASYTTDDNAEPHCFTDLPAGNYTVAVQPASGTVATSDKRWGVALTGGSTIKINFGSRSDANAPTSASGENNQDGSGSMTGLLAGAGGLILLLVAGVMGAFIIARRRG